MLGGVGVVCEELLRGRAAFAGVGQRDSRVLAESESLLFVMEPVG